MMDEHDELRRTMMGQQDLHALLGILALPDAPHDGHWGRWRFARIEGGGNNVLYRATDDRADLAVKFTARDARDRAGREYATLAALQHMGTPIAPAPILLERERFAHLVVVQTWLDGQVTIPPPTRTEIGDSCSIITPPSIASHRRGLTYGSHRRYLPRPVPPLAGSASGSKCG